MTYSAERSMLDIVTTLGTSDRPAIYLGMGNTEMDAVRGWLTARQEMADQILPARKDVYLQGVHLGLSQIGMGLSLLTYIAFPEGWSDAAGNCWRWNEAEFRPVIDGAEYTASNVDMNADELSEADFAAFARGVWDATSAARSMRCA